MAEKKEKTEEQKKEVPVTPEVTEQGSVKAEVKRGPRDYLVKAAELLKERGESKNIKIAITAIEEAILFIGKEGL